MRRPLKICGNTSCIELETKETIETMETCNTKLYEETETETEVTRETMEISGDT